MELAALEYLKSPYRYNGSQVSDRYPLFLIIIPPVYEEYRGYIVIPPVYDTKYIGGI